MKKTFHPNTVKCCLCGYTIPGPGKHWAEWVNRQWAFYCFRCSLLVAGKRKIRRKDREKINGQVNADRGSNRLESGSPPPPEA